MTSAIIGTAALYAAQALPLLELGEQVVLGAKKVFSFFTPLPEKKVGEYRTIQLNAPKTTASAKVQEVRSAISSADTIEHSCWYIDWTSWDFPVPEGVNLVNVFVGKIDYVNDQPSVTGFGNMTEEKLAAFVQQCNEKGIAVKISIGGGGGSYDNCWDLLTDENTSDFAQGLVNYCNKMGLAGVDFDYEEMGSAELNGRVGRLIREFKTLNPNLQTTYCTNAGFPTWQQRNKEILDGATDTQGKCYLDRFYIMTYYNPLQSELGWGDQWISWVGDNYGLTPAQVSFGIDNTDAHAYDISDMAKAAAQRGASTAHWYSNAGNDVSNQSAITIKTAYDSVAKPPECAVTSTKETKEKEKVPAQPFFSWLGSLIQTFLFWLGNLIQSLIDFTKDLLGFTAELPAYKAEERDKAQGTVPAEVTSPVYPQDPPPTYANAWLTPDSDLPPTYANAWLTPDLDLPPTYANAWLTPDTRKA